MEFKTTKKEKFDILIAALLFFPACIVGYLIGCAKAGYDTGQEIANDRN